MENKPTHEQAELHLKVYDLRREAKMREAREWFLKNYFAKSADESMQAAPPGTQNGAYFGMVVGYWEQACSLLNSGLLNEDLFFETNGEFFGVWERLKPALPGLREKFVYPPFLANMEKAAQRFEVWSERRAPGHIAAMRQFMQQMYSQMTASAKG